MWLCMCPAEKSSSAVNKIAYTTISLIIFAINVGCTVSGYMYFIKFRSIDLKGCLFAFMASSATLVVLYTMMSAYQMRYKIKQLFEKLLIICCSSKCLSLKQKKMKNKFYFKFAFYLDYYGTVSIEPLTEANKSSEWLCTICVIYLTSTFVSTAMISVCVGLFCWFINGNLDVNHLYHPLKLL